MGTHTCLDAGLDAAQIMLTVAGLLHFGQFEMDLPGTHTLQEGSRFTRVDKGTFGIVAETASRLYNAQQ